MAKTNILFVFVMLLKNLADTALILWKITARIAVNGVIIACSFFDVNSFLIPLMFVLYPYIFR